MTNCSVDNRTITAVLISCQVIKLQLPSSGVFLYQHLCCHNKDLILTFNEMLSLSWNHIMNYHHIVFCWWGMESQLTVVFFTNGQNFVRLAPSLVTFTFLSESELKSVEKKEVKNFQFRLLGNDGKVWPAAANKLKSDKFNSKFPQRDLFYLIPNLNSF